MKKRVTKRPAPVTPKKPRPAAMKAPERGAKRASQLASTVRPAVARVESFPIVGIGASAGGLEALEEFLRNVPSKSGMAYVVIQHLDPTHKGAMVELLQRVSSIPVVQTNDRQKVTPDCVYVIPPNKDMSILHGVLHLLPPASPHGLNLPIDFFFRSLADDQRERGIAVVLSGMGSDGTLGLAAIKEKAGASFVQSLETAKFGGMPRSAIEAGLADVVAPPAELPSRIVAYHTHAPYVRRDDLAVIVPDKQLTALEKVFVLLRARTGNDFSLYKRSTIYRRIERRMGLHQIDNITAYVRFLRENPAEVDQLFKELLIGVTSFFRDPQAWEHLADVLPALFRSRREGATIRAWVPGCSTGEEAYSLAMVLSETLEKAEDRRGFQIFATDLDRDAVERARQGVYPANIAVDVSAARIRRFFVQDERGYRMRKEIRESVVFAPQNLIMDPPFTKLDIVSCRNLLIYLAPELQRKLMPLFHYALNPGGILFLGSAETVGSSSYLFGTTDGKARVYRRIDNRPDATPVEFPPTLSSPPPRATRAENERMAAALATPMNLSMLAERAILQRFAPAAVLTNDKGDVLYISGRTGRYLEPAVGRPNFNVFAMARDGLRYELSAAFASAMRQDEPTTVRAPQVQTNGSSQAVDVTVVKLAEPKELRGMLLIAFADAATVAAEAPPERSRRAIVTARVAEVERELRQARAEIQSTREGMQTSQEELKSTNEELQSTNEELQSTNEELTTSKEEMQSMNEELQTVNHELQSKVDELSRSSNDMKNLLNSTEIATLFLDGQLRVRRFTSNTAKLIKLIPADAGRPITDIATELDYGDLIDDAREVLRTLAFRERAVATRDGRWFSVRIMPYRTFDNVIDGVVITFMDVTTAKRLERTLREQADHLKQMTASLPNLIWDCRPDGACDFVGERWLDYTGVREGEQLGYGWLEQVHPDDRARLRVAWKAAVTSSTTLETELRIRSKDGDARRFEALAVPIRDPDGGVIKWRWSALDVEEQKQTAARYERASERLEGIIAALDQAIVGLDDDRRITHFNAAAERLFERARESVIGKSCVDALVPPFDKLTLETKLDEAKQKHDVLSFEAPLGRVRLLPHAHGASIVVAPA